MSDKYILDGHTAVLCDDLLTWARAFDSNHRHVAQDTVNGVKVSTVFLGIDHSWGGKPPLLFETMIFGGLSDEYCERYSTWEEAEAGHARALAMVTELTP